MDQQDSFADSPDLDLADAIGQLASGMAAIHRELLTLVTEFDRRKAWRDDGASSMASWLCTRLGLRFANASEWVRVAGALESLPECARAFAEGRLAWDQVRPLTEVATPEQDATAAAGATGQSAAALEAAARRARRVPREEMVAQHDQRHLHWWFPAREGFRFTGRLSAADGAVVVEALERIASQEAEKEENPLSVPHASRLGDAFFGLALARLAEDADADRACVVVHVAAADLAGDGEGTAELEGGHPIHVDVARRLACDGRLEVVAEGPDGVVVGVGRARRTIPPWLWRLLLRRDGGGCRFPGCGHTRFLHAHHVVWWSKGGGTVLDNLIVICSHCHRLIHELGWTVTGNANGELTFRRPDGRVVANGPPGLRPAVRQELARVVGL
jgi:Domain of unknown function (DUF222)/HNH endonuclease